jgi:polar amino acid transport system permease protein
LPEVAEAFVFNVRLFLVAEVTILAVALVVAVIRVLPSPALMPLKLVAVVYTDVFRGTPTILVIFLVGFGFPALRLEGVPTSYFTLGLIALTLSYGAYVAEVVRAGIQSVHPSQVSSARALGLTYGQTMRLVVLPQGLRRVMPPLLNDFVSLQKDTALVAAAGVFDAVFAARDYGNFNFNYTPLVLVGGFFVVMTVPLARFCDWLQRRWMERERAGAL